MNEPMAMVLARAFDARAPLLDAAHEMAVRLFNGFTEGNPDLVVDLYGATAIINNYADPATAGTALVQETLEVLLARLPWMQAVIVKTRRSASAAERLGKLLFGARVDRRVREHGVWYAVDPLMSRDASLYLDTRNLRAWAIRELTGKTVLNTFAYTGSLGVAALAGGATRVAQLDRNGEFLNVAKASYALNGFPVHKQDFLLGDFFSKISYLKKAGARFDCIFLDPPFFATGQGGTVDLVNNSARLINKVRPLLHDGGRLVTINNALFVSGQSYYDTLTALCASGYLQITELIDVPPDFTGYPDTKRGTPVTDPHPFNHATNIAVLEVVGRKE
ncbi:MAG TPA: class I SAM-dependent methyltransferase [Armatimonadota bacterium]|jgi:23S rRNA (cytosine1962-C5)-methyltransferase